ncbi:MAG: hypothetical protein R3F19_14005 [Verrucomicrobiales bacterium]
MLQHGLVDRIVERRDMRGELVDLLHYMMPDLAPAEEEHDTATAET